MVHIQPVSHILALNDNVNFIAERIVLPDICKQLPGWIDYEGIADELQHCKITIRIPVSIAG